MVRARACGDASLCALAVEAACGVEDRATRIGSIRYLPKTLFSHPGAILADSTEPASPSDVRSEKRGVGAR